MASPISIDQSVTGVVLVAPLLTDSGRWLPLDLIVNEVRIANVVPEAGMSANGHNKTLSRMRPQCPICDEKVAGFFAKTHSHLGQCIRGCAADGAAIGGLSITINSIACGRCWTI